MQRCGKDWWALVLCSLALWRLLGASPVAAEAERRRGGRALLTTQCKQYTPGQCALVRQASDGHATLPFCHIGDGVPVECSFDTQPLEQCPLPKQGNFSNAESSSTHGPATCRTPFMTLKRNDSQNVCGKVCCAADLPGAFGSQTSHGQQQLQYQPHNTSAGMGCVYHQYNWREAMSCLAGSKVVIAGDSVMRNLFNSGIALFRGEVAVLDYNKHAHGRYTVCETADHLSFGSYVPKRWEIPLSDIASVFAEPPEECQASPSLEMHYLWAPRFMDLTPTLLEYHNTFSSGAAAAASSREQLSYIVFAGFWEDQQAVPQDFLAALDTLRGAAKAVILVGVPRIRLYEWKKDNAKVRNDKMRAWVQSRADSGNVFYLDFEHLTHAEGAPLPIGSLNWHYQCFLDHDHPRDQSGALQGSWAWPEAPERSYSSVWTDDAVTCTDEMDATIWQLVFNLLCNRREHS